MFEELNSLLKKLYPDAEEYGWHTEHISNSKTVQEINRKLNNEEKQRELLDQIYETIDNERFSDTERVDRIDSLLSKFAERSASK